MPPSTPSWYLQVTEARTNVPPLHLPFRRPLSCNITGCGRSPEDGSCHKMVTLGYLFLFFPELVSSVSSVGRQKAKTPGTGAAGTVSVQIVSSDVRFASDSLIKSEQEGGGDVSVWKVIAKRSHKDLSLILLTHVTARPCDVGLSPPCWRQADSWSPSANQAVHSSPVRDPVFKT